MMLPLRAALLIFALGFALAWFGGGGFCTAAIDTDPALWPPGATECEYKTATGERREDVVVPWGWWFAFAATGISGGGRTGGHPPTSRRPARLNSRPLPE